MPRSQLKYQALLFDWDGTLLDSLDAKVASAGLVFLAHLQTEPAQVASSYRRWSGIPRRDLFDRIALDTVKRPLDDSEFLELSARFSEINRRQLREAHLYPGAREILSDLDRAGARVLVSSAASTGEVTDLVNYFGLAPFCRAILGSEGANHKGRPHVTWCAETFGLGLNSIACVGDEPRDIELAREAGVDALAVAHTHTAEDLAGAEPTFVARNLAELWTYLTPHR